MFYPLLGNHILSPILSTQNNMRNEITITIDSQTHIDFGLSYPVTYEIDIPNGSKNLNEYIKYSSSQNWNLIDKKP